MILVSAFAGLITQKRPPHPHTHSTLCNTSHHFHLHYHLIQLHFLRLGFVWYHQNYVHLVNLYFHLHRHRSFLMRKNMWKCKFFLLRNFPVKNKCVPPKAIPHDSSLSALILLHHSSLVHSEKGKPSIFRYPTHTSVQFLIRMSFLFQSHPISQ